MEETQAVAGQELDDHAALRDIHEVIRMQATRVAELQAALDAAQQELHEVRAEAAAREEALALQINDLRSTRLYRWSAAPRRLYGALRRAIFQGRRTA